MYLLCKRETALKKGFLQTWTGETPRGTPYTHYPPIQIITYLRQKVFSHQPPLGTTLKCLGQDLDRILTDSKWGQMVLLIRCSGDFWHYRYFSHIWKQQTLTLIKTPLLSNCITKSFLIFANIRPPLITCLMKRWKLRDKLSKDCNLLVCD